MRTTTSTVSPDRGVAERVARGPASAPSARAIRSEAARLLRPPAQGLERLRGDRADGPAGHGHYGGLCGWTLARAHAPSGDRIAIASYLEGGDSFDRAILEFSNAYAEQNERDYQQLAAAVKSGRITAQTGL
jgi:hypothetical protein